MLILPKYARIDKILKIVYDVSTDPSIKRTGKAIRKRINDLAPEDVEKVRHGEWIRFRLGDEDFCLRYECSRCKRVIYPGDERNLPDYPYCHCGAKMDGGK